MKAVKINRCSDSMFWYSSYIGSIVPLLRDGGDYFMVREPAGYSNIVKKTDGNLVDVDKDAIKYVNKTN